MAARRAIETSNINYDLIWFRPQDEVELNEQKVVQIIEDTKLVELPPAPAGGAPAEQR